MKKIFKSKLFLQVIVASMVATLATALIVSAATTIGENISTGGTLAVTGASTFTASSTVNGIIMDSTKFIVEDGSGNTTIGGTLGVTGALSFATASSTGQVKVASLGIASSTPAAGFQLSIGTGASASSTISMGKFCMYAAQEDGVEVYLRLGANQPANQPFATSTVPCN